MVALIVIPLGLGILRRARDGARRVFRSATRETTAEQVKP